VRHFPFTFTCNLQAQDNRNNEQSPNFEQLLNEKRKINPLLTVNERYKIQIFSGDSDTAKNHFMTVNRSLISWTEPLYLILPNYKVWIREFQNKN
jgi:hypothetical protein